MATRSMQSGPDREEPDRPIAEIPLAEIDVSRPSLFQSDKVGAFFERLRREDPLAGRVKLSKLDFVMAALGAVPVLARPW